MDSAFCNYRFPRINAASESQNMEPHLGCDVYSNIEQILKGKDKNPQHRIYLISSTFTSATSCSFKTVRLDRYSQTKNFIFFSAF